MVNSDGTRVALSSCIVIQEVLEIAKRFILSVTIRFDQVLRGRDLTRVSHESVS